MTFDIKEGQTLGIMGSTGSGKTTIINLLKRMYDVSEGAVLVDGKNIKDMKLDTLRKNISVVMQDVFLFSETISGNVKLGEKETLEEEPFRQAMEDSVSEEFVSKLDDRYETVIGERGVGLSGGQKQRLTMARAMSRNAPVLVFDDSTSALDAETEKKIQHTLNEMKGMTKIIIAHRISSVKNADKIIVLDKGRIKETLPDTTRVIIAQRVGTIMDADQIIVLDKGRIAEAGTHEELLKLKGLYAETYETQYGGLN